MGATPRKFKNGEILFQEGAPTGSVFLIQRGEVSIRKRRGSGTVEIARLRPSQLLGELSFFDRRPRSATAVALGTVEVVEIDFAALDGIYESVPSYFKAMMTALATRLRAANDTIRRLEQEAAKAAAEAEARTSKAIAQKAFAEQAFPDKAPVATRPASAQKAASGPAEPAPLVASEAPARGRPEGK